MFLWIYGLCSPFAGYMADHVGRKPIIIESLGLLVRRDALAGFVQSFEEMLIARALLGVSESVLHARGGGGIVDHHSARTRSRATRLHLSGVYVGSVLDGLGGWLAEQQGWRFGFVLFGSSVSFTPSFSSLCSVSVTVVPQQTHPGAPPWREGEASWLPIPPGRSRPPTSGPFLRPLLVTRVRADARDERIQWRAYWPVRNWLPSFFNSELGINPLRGPASTAPRPSTRRRSWECSWAARFPTPLAVKNSAGAGARARRRVLPRRPVPDGVGGGRDPADAGRVHLRGGNVAGVSRCEPDARGVYRGGSEAPRAPGTG